MNAPKPLEIGTPDGSGQAVHPDVVFQPEGLWGSRYWMACTPYPFGRDRLENPIVRVSQDGIVWRPVDGLPDPLVDPPVDRDSHHADPDLVLTDGTLSMVYMTTNKRHRRTTFSLMSTSDGLRWSEPNVIHEGTWGVSPAITHQAGEWSLWYVELDTSRGFGPSRVWRRRGTDPAHLGSPDDCQIDIPGHVVWHLDVQPSSEGFEALVAAFPAGRDTSHTRLFHLGSTDGAIFSGPRLVIAPSALGWDSRFIYRSTFVKQPSGEYRIWYSAGSWNRRTGIGLVEGPLDRLRPIPDSRPSVADRAAWGLDAVVGYSKYRVKPLVPAALLRRRER